MRIGVISDIHANVDALAGVLSALERESVEEIVSLGDVVGYNAFPMETIILLQKARAVSVLGNHDLMVLGRLPLTDCGPRGRRAAEWTTLELSPVERRFLEGLPEEIRRRDDVLFIHSTLGNPVARLHGPPEFLQQHRVLTGRYPRLRICFTGHTHQQRVTEIPAAGGVRAHTGDEVRIDGESFFFVNPGSVGEPREGDKRAAFAVYDTERSVVAFHRVAYDRSRVLRENARHGLGAPESPSIVKRVRGLVRLAAGLVAPRDW